MVIIGFYSVNFIVLDERFSSRFSLRLHTLFSPFLGVFSRIFSTAMPPRGRSHSPVGAKRHRKSSEDGYDKDHSRGSDKKKHDSRGSHERHRSRSRSRSSRDHYDNRSKSNRSKNRDDRDHRSRSRDRHRRSRSLSVPHKKDSSKSKHKKSKKKSKDKSVLQQLSHLEQRVNEFVKSPSKEDGEASSNSLSGPVSDPNNGSVIIPVKLGEDTSHVGGVPFDGISLFASNASLVSKAAYLQDTPKPNRDQVRNELFRAMGVSSPPPLLERFLIDSKQNTETSATQEEAVPSKQPVQDQQEVDSEMAKYFSSAPTFKLKKQYPTVPLDNAQVELVQQFFTPANPKSLTAYTDETYKLLTPEKKYEDLLEVPSLDNFIKFVNTQEMAKQEKTPTKEGYRHGLWTNYENDLRRVHRGTRVGVMSAISTQRVLLKAAEYLTAQSKEGTIPAEAADSLHSLLVVAFDTTNRSLEQCAKLGGVVHMLRRRVVLDDIGCAMRQRDLWQYLPLSGDGIMGEKFVKALESRDKMSRE